MDGVSFITIRGNIVMKIFHIFQVRFRCDENSMKKIGVGNRVLRKGSFHPTPQYTVVNSDKKSLCSVL